MQKAAKTTDPAPASAPGGGDTSGAPIPAKAPSPAEIMDAFLGTGLPGSGPDPVLTEAEPGLPGVDGAGSSADTPADDTTSADGKPDADTKQEDEVIDMSGGKPEDDAEHSSDDKGGRVPRWAENLSEETKAELRRYRANFLDDIGEARKLRDTAKSELERAQAELTEAKSKLQSQAAGVKPVQVPWDPLSTITTEEQLQSALQTVDRNIDWALQRIDGYEHKDDRTGETRFVEPEAVRNYLQDQRAIKQFETPTRERLRKSGIHQGTVQTRYPKELLDDAERKTAFESILAEDPVIARHPRYSLMVHDTITMDLVRAGKFKLVRASAKPAPQSAADSKPKPHQHRAPLSASGTEPPVKPVRHGQLDVPSLRAAAEKGDKTAQAKLQELIVFGTAA